MIPRDSEPGEEQFQRLSEAPELADKVIDDFLGEAAHLWGAQRMVQSALEGNFGEFDRPASKVALVDGTLCGAILFTRPAPTEGFIAEIAVSPAHQGKGLGGAILSGALATAWTQGTREFNLAATADNGPALTLYHRMGFVPKERITAYIWRPNGVNQEEANG
jgi:ribosomal protein S18 acetylase RimI-like enzyme